MSEFNIQSVEKLKKIQPSKKWQKQNRQLLLHQVCGGEKVISQNKISFYLHPLFILKSLSHGAIVAFFVGVFVLLGGVIGLRAAKDAKPGDTLYAAKIFNEKTQLVLTFDEKEKARLGLEFAANRAHELEQILSENQNDKTNSKHVEKLIYNFKKNITEAKTNIAKISKRPNKRAKDNFQQKDFSKQKNSETSIFTTSTPVADKDEEMQVFSANLNKEDKGVEVYDPNAVNSDKESQRQASDLSGNDSIRDKEGTDKTSINNTDNNIIGSSTVKTSASSTDSDKNNNQEILAAGDILKQAEEYLSKEDYEATINILNRADQVIDSAVNISQTKEERVGSSTGEVLGVTTEETGSSTEK